MQEEVHLTFGAEAQMPSLMKLDEPTNPMEAGLLGAAAVVPPPEDLDDAVEQPRNRLVRKQTERPSCGDEWRDHGPTLRSPLAITGVNKTPGQAIS